MGVQTPYQKSPKWRTTFNFTWHDCISFTNTPRRIQLATCNARRLTLRNFFFHDFFFSFFTGRVYSGSSWYGWIVITIASAGHDAKLVVFNKIAELRPATMFRHYLREPCTPMKMEDAGSWNPSFYRPLLNSKKKINQRKRIFFTRSKLKCILPNFKIPSKTPHFTQQKNAMSVRNLKSVVQV